MCACKVFGWAGWFRHCCYHKIIKADRAHRETKSLGKEPPMKLNKNDEAVIAALKAAPGSTMAEIAEKSSVPSKKVFKSLKKLFEAEMIDSAGRKYTLLTDKPPAKGKDEEAAEEED